MFRDKQKQIMLEKKVLVNQPDFCSCGDCLCMVINLHAQNSDRQISNDLSQ